MKKGVSPLIATVLLIAFVVVLASIIFLWARGFVDEKVSKFGEPIERACDSVKFEAGVFEEGSNYVLEINNQAEVPLYGFDVKKKGVGRVDVNNILPEGGAITLGESTTIEISSSELELDSGDELLVVPLVLGESDNGKVSFTCPDTSAEEITV